MTNIVPYEEPEIKETPERKRKRLAAELRCILHQYNSKVAEALQAGLMLSIDTSQANLKATECILKNLEVSYQAPPKYY